MKEAEKDKPVQTTPKGAWEGGITSLHRNDPIRHNPDEFTTDSQGNGYPVSGKRHSDIISDYRHK